MQKKIDFLVEWLKQQSKISGMNGALVGLSGGIDSAVVGHLIKRAFGENTLGVIMPCKSNPEDKEHAIAAAESADLDYMIIDLTDAHDVLFSSIKTTLNKKNDWNEEAAKLGDGNLRARLRMSTLYAVSNNYGGYFVVGTDNAAEWYTGYFTKYGDGGVDLVPLVHLTKGEVKEMAKTLGVPDSIIEKKPSAGLWEGQTDEDEMGTTYDQIDAYIKGREVPEEDRKVIEHLHSESSHKRQLAAAPPKFNGQ